MLEEAMKLSFEFVNNCKPGDLLRVKVEDAAEFAILGANEGHSLRALVVLKDNEPPFAINLLESGRIDGDFETYAALVYGKWEILPDHSDRCEIGTGPLFTKVGALVLAEGGSRSLVVAGKTGKSPRYFDLTSWKLREEPGGQRAAFKTWSLWHDGLARSAPSARLLGSSVE
jgi:hypothetical protein